MSWDGFDEVIKKCKHAIRCFIPSLAEKCFSIGLSAIEIRSMVRARAVVLTPPFHTYNAIDWKLRYISCSSSAAGQVKLMELVAHYKDI